MSLAHVEDSHHDDEAGNVRPLSYLYWRDELLQVMYWMLGEGLGSRPSVEHIVNFLAADPQVVAPTLRRMAEEGFVVEVEPGTYSLSELGMSEGGRSFSDEFSGLTNQAHGECSPDCTFCHSPDGDPLACPSKTHSHAAAG